ncbi:MAG TPA: glycosyltransferase family 2 protein [Candidatus Nanoarchaeia archaeon]|nr:glycosyltransferase family 2 protein [Candidatus Nanoarchaeia archaeon]
MKLSLVIPTYNEKENIEKIVKRILEEFKENKINAEIIIVDDNSPDGTGKILKSLKEKHKNIKVINRKEKTGLSSAVLEGWKISDGEVLGVIDADLSHPPGKIKELFWAIESGEADFTVGSRYVKGGKIEGWNLKRKLMSKIATLLSRVYTKVKDPMTGFFMIKREVIKNVDLNPKGFKILLEIIIKGKYNKVKEIPITFINRVEGESKAGVKEIICYLQNLVGYLDYKKNVIKEFVKFGIVGGIGTLVNIAILYLFTEKIGVYYIISAILSFIVAMTSNFILNKTWTFNENIKLKIGKEYLQFSLVSFSALLVNLFFLYIFTEVLGVYYIISQIIAIGIALIINFFGNKIWTFSK